MRKITLRNVIKCQLYALIGLTLTGCFGWKQVDDKYAKIAGNASSIDARASFIQDVCGQIMEQYQELKDAMKLITMQAAKIRVEAVDVQQQAWNLQGELQTERNWRVYEQDRASWFFSPKQRATATIAGVVFILSYVLRFILGGSAIGTFLGGLLPFGNLSFLSKRG